MNQVELYQPKVFSASIDLPGEYNELNQAELLFICQQMLLPYKNPEIFYSVVFIELLKRRAATQGIDLPKDWVTLLNIEDIALQQRAALEWLYTKTDLTDQHFEHVEINGRNFFGPCSNFNDITCGEYEDCEVFSFRYNSTKEIEHLAMMAAILYRPMVNYERVAYAGYKVEQALPKFKKLAPELLFAIYVWYAGCRGQLPKIFKKLFQGGSSGQPDIAAFTKCIHAGAGDRNGTRDKIRATLLKEFMLDMNMQAEEAARIEQEMKNLQK